jgi:hypothetical protein
VGDLGEAGDAEAGGRAGARAIDWLDAEPFLERLRSYGFGGPEDRGEVRLVAWAPDPHPGQAIEPKVDRHRGFRLVVAHLDYGPPPDASQEPYYSARGPFFKPPRARSLGDPEEAEDAPPEGRPAPRFRGPAQRARGGVRMIQPVPPGAATPGPPGPAVPGGEEAERP